jgi:CRP/FNR family transcriptional regulator
MAAHPKLVQAKEVTHATPCFDCPIRHTAICKAVHDRDLPGFFSLVTEHHFKPGDTIAETGAPAEFVDIVRTGSAFIYRILPDLQRAIMRMLMPTSIFGLTSFGQYSFNVEATTDTIICRFNKDDFEQLMADTPEVQHEVRHHMSVVTRILEERIVTMGMKSSLERVVSFITHIWAFQKWPVTDNPSFELPLSRTEIADMTGLSPETVSKCFTVLRQMKIIDLPRPNEIRVLNQKMLFALGYSPTDLPADVQELLQNFQKSK